MLAVLLSLLNIMCCCILINITLLNGAFLSVLIISVFCCLVPYFPVGFHGNDNKKYPGSVWTGRGNHLQQFTVGNTQNLTWCSDCWLLVVCLFVCLFFFMVVRNVCITVDLANWVAPFPSQLNHVIVSLFQGSVLNLTGTAKGWVQCSIHVHFSTR